MYVYIEFIPGSALTISDRMNVIYSSLVTVIAVTVIVEAAVRYYQFTATVKVL